MTQPTILPDPQQLRLCALSAEADDNTITAIVEPTASSCACPVCGHLARRVHSRYTRHLADLPWHGVAFRLQLRSRKFFCDHPTCARHIFTQRFPDVVAPYARRTQRLAHLLELVAAVVGGTPGVPSPRQRCTPRRRSSGSMTSPGDGGARSAPSWWIWHAIR
jgi:transposase